MNLRATKGDVSTRLFSTSTQPKHIAVTNVRKIPLADIQADEQSRKHFDQDKLQQLAANLRQHGQLQPCRVRWLEERNTYVVIAGERRYRAAKLAGFDTLDCIVVKDASDDKARLENILENAQREDLQPLEQARAFQTLMDNQGWGVVELASNIHLNHSTVSRALKLLQLPEDIQAKIESGQLSPTEALRATNQTKSPTPKRRRITREEKIATAKGTVTVKGRRLMTDDVLIDALTQALEFVRQRQQTEDQQPKAA